MLFFHYLCSVKEQLNYIISQLRGYIPEEELQDLGYWIIEETTGMSRTEILTGCKDTKKIPNIEIILEKLRAHVPVQYVFEHTEWMGLDLRVTPDTLIPRPETAELIEWILESTDCNKPFSVADIGTGSGCIAIAIKQRRKLWNVCGMDISEGALKVAQENAQRNQVQINWKKVDILTERIASYDIVVSNPPYICDKEKAEMEARVLKYEPHGALFVPDSDPLLFYRRIASLKVAKQLFFEINEAYGTEVCAMLKEMGYKNITLKHDMYGKPRMVFAAIDC
jgi:release factor glutamine methyltransferase